MGYEMRPVGEWSPGDETPWYTIQSEPILITDANVAGFNGGVTEVKVGEVIVDVQDKTDGGTGARVFPSWEHDVKTSVPTVGEVDTEESEEIERGLSHGAGTQLTDAEQADVASDAEEAAGDHPDPDALNLAADESINPDDGEAPVREATVEARDETPGK